jgi:uncharacterized protein YggU (UPF0235/DUF167 family)
MRPVLVSGYGRSVSIVRGGSSRDKVVRVDGMEPADAHAPLDS